MPITTVTPPSHRAANPAAESPALRHQAAENDRSAPQKADLFGVGVSVVDPAGALAQIMSWARERRPRIVDFMGVHGLTLAQSDSEFRNRLNQFDMVCCDGQPIRWALNHWHGASLGERVYGPAMTIAACRAAADQGVSVYFYGSRVEVLDQLTARIGGLFPKLKIAGAEAPPFRPLSEEESQAATARINQSGAGLVFIGLGCPKQEIFAADHRSDIHAVQLCVGAAFDIHAGLVPMAPAWMQNAGLEWLYRLCREPRRLGKRYLVGNTKYVKMCLARLLFGYQ